jgi:transposase-like protein
MSRKKNLIQLLESLEKPEFDEVVKTYLKEEYGFERIANTDDTPKNRTVSLIDKFTANDKEKI